MKAILSIFLLVFLSLSSCRCPEREKNCTCKVCESFGTTPGYNSTFSVTPTVPSQPALWVAWNLDGDKVTGGGGTTHSVWVGSESQAFEVGDVTVLQNTTYELVITNLEANPGVGVTVKNTTAGPPPPPYPTANVEPIDATSAAFAVSVHNNPANNATFLLIITGPNGGVKLVLS